jgi:hypothetical protein
MKTATYENPSVRGSRKWFGLKGKLRAGRRSGQLPLSILGGSSLTQGVSWACSSHFVSERGVESVQLVDLSVGITQEPVAQGKRPHGQPQSIHHISGFGDPLAA